ncbi:MAG TPA: ABC transporter permease subunit [Pirellulaceae bacterium]|nr:ABC transporter permease subunit [Pirellulaceae bacterium]
MAKSLCLSRGCFTNLVTCAWWFAGCLLVSLNPAAGQQTDALHRIQQSGVFRWGADREGGGPFVYPDPNDPVRLLGFEVEIAELLAARLGVEAQFCQGQWDKLPDLLDRGDVDIVLNGYEWSANRAHRYGTSVPYYIYELQLLGRASDPAESWEDLFRLPRKPRIAVLGGSAAQDYLQTLYPDRVDIIQYEGATDAMRGVELALDGLDANLQDLPVWTFYRGSFTRLKALGDPVGRGYYVVLTRKADSALLQVINDTLIDALRDGRLRNIYTKYQMWNTTQAQRGLETNPTGGFVGDARQPADAVDSETETTDYVAVRGWGVIWQRGWLLVRAAGMTAVLAILAMPLAILIGLLATLLRLYGPRWLAWLPISYIELVRGTPLVLQLYVLFFLLPELGIAIGAFWAAILGLAINYSAYEAEIYRAGIQAIPRGQIEAAQALGMSRWLTIRRIIVPQATRIVVPPVTNDFIALFKDTAVCSVITVVELSKEYYIHARSTGAIVELGLLTALLYLAMSYPLSILATRLERWLHRERQE